MGPPFGPPNEGTENDQQRPQTQFKRTSAQSFNFPPVQQGHGTITQETVYATMMKAPAPYDINLNRKKIQRITFSKRCKGVKLATSNFVYRMLVACNSVFAGKTILIFPFSCK